MSKPTPRSRFRRPLRFEQIEQRLLLAGDTYLVNFQFDEVGTPVRHLRDTGAVFGDRGNGFNYGWSSNHTDLTRVRGIDPDLRLDTLTHVHAGGFWEFELPNGSYEVTVAVGDPENNDGLHTVNVEGVSFFNAVADTNVAQFANHDVTVSDGRLTLDVGTAAEKATRIDYIYIVGLPSGANAPPSAPTITEPSMVGQVVNPADFHMEGVGFFDSDGNAHKSTDWQILEGDSSGPVVWQTPGIEGVERLHTHLGDGVFINSHAGFTSLQANTNYVLRARFRDDAGSVSSWSERAFQTGQASTTFPMELDDVAESPAPIWIDIFDVPVELPAGNSVLSPGDPIIAVDTDGVSSYPGNESPQNAIDGTLAKYLNFGEANSGFIVTPANPTAVVTSFQITTANDAVERDPSQWRLDGTNDAISSTDNSDGSGESWTLIDSGSLSLPTARDTGGSIIPVSNSTAYSSYRMLFPTVKNGGAANSMQIAEVQFFTDANPSAVPPSLELVGGETGSSFLTIQGDTDPGNIVTDAPAFAGHESLRLIINGGSEGLNLALTNLTVYDEGGAPQTVYLPAISLGPNERLDLWVAAGGATYFGTAAQTEPDFSSLARASDAAVDVPFTAVQSGYVVDAVAGGMQLPTNIAFVPSPGPNPDDPFFYVTELYGTVKVVTRDFTVSDYATGLLNFNPTGSFPGSGEQGLTGIVVDPLTGDVFATRVTATNPANPNGDHHPQVLRFTSTDGGRTAATTNVILDMPGETQGQSHQISNLTIGPDGKLYVHNGDGFSASTALNMSSYRGKVLRLNLDGSAPTDNPFYNAGNGINATDYIYAYGLRNPFGGAWRDADAAHYEVENGPSIDRLARVDEGESYGWNGSDASMTINAIYNWNPAHAPVNMTFVQDSNFFGSQFPAQQRDMLFVSESGPTYGEGPQSRGKRIVQFDLAQDGSLESGPTTLVEYTGAGRGTVVGLAAGPDGLYFTELYKDLDAVTPIDAGARVFRVRYVGQTPGDYNGDDQTNGSDFLAWQRGSGSTTNLAADGDRDRLVTQNDLTFWQTHYGSSAEQSAVSAMPQNVQASATSSLAVSADEQSASLAGSAPGVVTSLDAPATGTAAEASVRSAASQREASAYLPATRRPGSHVSGTAARDARRDAVLAALVELSAPLTEVNDSANDGVSCAVDDALERLSLGRRFGQGDL